MVSSAVALHPVLYFVGRLHLTGRLDLWQARRLDVGACWPSCDHVAPPPTGGAWVSLGVIVAVLHSAVGG